MWLCGAKPSSAQFTSTQIEFRNIQTQHIMAFIQFLVIQCISTSNSHSYAKPTEWNVTCMIEFNAIYDTLKRFDFNRKQIPAKDISIRWKSEFIYTFSVQSKPIHWNWKRHMLKRNELFIQQENQNGQMLLDFPLFNNKKKRSCFLYQVDKQSVHEEEKWKQNNNSETLDVSTMRTFWNVVWLSV